MAALRGIPNSYAADWTSGLGLDWVDIFGHTPSGVGGKLVYNESNCADGNARPMPKFMLGANAPLVIEVTSTFTGTLAAEALPVEAGYRAVSLYNGEWNYAGVYLVRSGAVDIIDFPPGATGMVWLKNGTAVKPPGWWVSGDEITVKVEYNPAAGETYFSIKKNAGAYELLYTRTDGVNGRAWTGPSSLWLQNYRMEGAGWSLEIGNISITRTADKKILGGAFDFYGWGGWQAASQALWADWPSFDDTVYQTYNGVFEQWREGGTEGCPTAGGMMGSYFEEPDDPAGNFYAHAGTKTDLSPEIPTDSGFSTLYLYGKQNVGTTRHRITDAAGVLISDAVIAGNSTGFFADGGSFIPLSVDISAVTESSIRIETVTTVPIESKDYPIYQASVGPSSYDWSTVWHGFMAESGLPSVAAEPATTTPTATTAALTGTLIAASATTAPIATNGQLIGTLAATSASATPQAEPAALVGIIHTDSAATTPTATVATLDCAEPETGCGSIRSPSGAVVQQFRADGTQVTSFRYVSGAWQ